MPEVGREDVPEGGGVDEPNEGRKRTNDLPAKFQQNGVSPCKDSNSRMPFEESDDLKEETFQPSRIPRG